MKTSLLLSISLFSFSLFSQSVSPVFPEILTQFPNLRDFTVSASEDEAYFTAQSILGDISVIMRIDVSTSEELELRIASFSGVQSDLEPFLAPDGLSLYFASNRPATVNDTTKDFDIWKVMRSTANDPWSEPFRLPAPVNSELNEFYPAVAANGNLYFTLLDPALKSEDDIFMCELDGDQYKDPVILGSGINTPGAEYNAYVSPDEQMIIFGAFNRKGGVGRGDLYMSVKNEAGIWNDAALLPTPINSVSTDFCPFVNTTTNTLYFTSRRVKDYGSTKGLADANSLLKRLNQYENGSSRLYKVSGSELLKIVKGN